VAFDGARVRFLPFPIRGRATGSDKPRKQRFLIRDAAQGPARDGYIHFLDADDILHPRLVAHIVTDNNGHGYSVTHGWVVDFAARRIPSREGTPVRIGVNRLVGDVCGGLGSVAHTGGSTDRWTGKRTASRCFRPLSRSVGRRGPARGPGGGSA